MVVLTIQELIWCSNQKKLETLDQSKSKHFRNGVAALRHNTCHSHWSRPYGPYWQTCRSRINLQYLLRVLGMEIARLLLIMRLQCLFVDKNSCILILFHLFLSVFVIQNSRIRKIVEIHDDRRGSSSILIGLKILKAILVTFRFLVYYFGFISKPVSEFRLFWFGLFLLLKYFLKIWFFLIFLIIHR